MHTILVADDSVTMQRAVELALAHEPLEIVRAMSGAEALTRARARRPDLVLVDHALGDQTGLELVEALRREAVTREVPVLVLGTSATWDEARARAAGVAGRVDKPFECQVLLERVRAALGVPAPAAGPDAPPITPARAPWNSPPDPVPAPTAGAVATAPLSTPRMAISAALSTAAAVARASTPPSPLSAAGSGSGAPAARPPATSPFAVPPGLDAPRTPPPPPAFLELSATKSSMPEPPIPGMPQEGHAAALLGSSAAPAGAVALRNPQDEADFLDTAPAGAVALRNPQDEADFLDTTPSDVQTLRSPAEELPYAATHTGAADAEAPPTSETPIALWASMVDEDAEAAPGQISASQDAADSASVSFARALEAIIDETAPAVMETAASRTEPETRAANTANAADAAQPPNPIHSQDKTLSAEARQIVERVAWQVVPELAERIIREEIQRLLQDR